MFMLSLFANRGIGLNFEIWIRGAGDLIGLVLS